VAELSARHYRRIILFWAPVAYLLLALFPGIYAPLRVGLDGSWVIGLNLLAQSTFRFGRDVVYSYGPLGYLLAPLPMGANLRHAVLFWVTMHALWAVLLVHLRLRIPKHGPFLLFAAMFTGSIALGLPYEYYLLFLVAFLLAWVPRAAAGWRTAAPLVGGLAAFFCLIKLTLGLAAILLALGAGTCWLVQDPKKALRSLSLTLGAFVLVFAGLSAIYLRSLPALRQWLVASAELTRDYNTAMSVVGPVEFLVLGLLALVVVERLLERPGRARLDLTVIVALSAWFAFKHGFGRQDRHVLPFFPFLLCLIGLLAVFAEDRRRRLQCLLTYSVVLVLSLPAIVHYDPSILRGIPRLVAGGDGSSRIAAIFRLPRVERDLIAQDELALRASLLDAETQKTIRENAGTVGIVPWEISLVPANRLPWRPTPVLQTHMAYTAYLDELNASQFRGRQAPQSLLLEFADIDGRNPILSSPATYRAILENYEAARVLDRPKWLLLKKRIAPRPLRFESGGLGQAWVGQWVEVPATDSLLFVRIGLDLNPAGRLAQAVFRIPALGLDLELAGGGIESYRFLPGTAWEGLLIGCAVRSSTDLEDLLRGGRGPRIARFRILGDGAVYYGRRFRLQWLAAGWSPAIQERAQ
jgi:hypothetical protein